MVKRNIAVTYTFNKSVIICLTGDKLKGALYLPNAQHAFICDLLQKSRNGSSRLMKITRSYTIGPLLSGF